MGFEKLLPDDALDDAKNDIETLESGVEEGFEHLIDSSEYIGRGKDAVIFRFSGDTLSDEDVKVLNAQGLLPDGQLENSAAKILKVYNPGAGEREAAIQAKAKEVLDTARDQDVAVCEVPSVFVAHDQKISKTTSVFLNMHGAELSTRAEIIVMDYVDGKDLGTLMYDFVLRGDGIEEDSLEVMTYEEKEQQVGALIGFEISRGNKGTPEEVESERSILFARNEEKLISFIRKKGFKLEPDVIDVLERSIHILHKHGIYHNDIHKRNVMIGREGKPYLIDFGQSAAQPEDGALEDLAAPRMWRRLTKTLEQEDLEKKQSASKEIEQIAGRLMQQPSYKERFDALTDSVLEKGKKALENELSRSRGSDTLLERFFIGLKPLKANDEISDVVQEFILGLSSPDMHWRPAELNMVKRFKESGFWS